MKGMMRHHETSAWFAMQTLPIGKVSVSGVLLQELFLPGAFVSLYSYSILKSASFF